MNELTNNQLFWAICAILGVLFGFTVAYLRALVMNEIEELHDQIGIEMRTMEYKILTDLRWNSALVVSKLKPTAKKKD